MDPIQVKVPYRPRRWLSDGMEGSRPWAHSLLIYADHWPSQPTYAVVEWPVAGKEQQ